MDLTAAAAALAPEIDRLVVAGHRHVRARRAEITAMAERAGLESHVLIVDIRPFLLDGPVPVSLVEAFARFFPPNMASDAVASWRRTGLMGIVGSDLVPSDATVRWAEKTTRLQSRVMEELWASATTEVERLVDAAQDAVAAAIRVDAGLPLFGALARLEEPAGPAAYVLHHRLTLLRYLRSDLHVAALAAAGLELHDQARIVDAAWRGGMRLGDWDGDAVRRLVAEGWLEADGVRLTATGRAHREAIEAATNRGVADALVGVPQASVQALVELLPRLPG